MTASYATLADVTDPRSAASASGAGRDRGFSADDLVDATRRLGGRLTAMLEDVQRLPVHRPRTGEHAPWYPAHLGGHAPDRREALEYDVVPRTAVPPTWGPPVVC